MKSILQDWVMSLGLRHQGVLLTAVRGCDAVSRENASKALTRCYRATILNAHCGDPKKAATFIEAADNVEVMRRMSAVTKDHDSLPHHYLMHLIHAAEIVGYKHPDDITRSLWRTFYNAMCRKLHMTPETEAELDERLNADEATFAARD